MAKYETVILYEGPSSYDGNPIVVLAQRGVGSGVSSKNAKTGDMVQTFILLVDVDPITASRTGQDKAVCGDCPHMGTPHKGDTGTAKDRTCYVTLCHAPLGKWKAYKKGAYKRIEGHEAIRAFALGLKVRLGTYGDPAYAPSYIWESLLSASAGHTGYTHGKVNPMPDNLMTSADTATQAQAAWHRGERTFRVISDLVDVVKGSEVVCPASAEAGQRTTCDKCKLCSGAGVAAKSIAIVAHGGSKRKAKEKIAAMA